MAGTIRTNPATTEDLYTQRYSYAKFISNQTEMSEDIHDKRTRTTCWTECQCSATGENHSLLMSHNGQPPQKIQS